VVDGLARAGGVKLDKLQEGAAVARCSVAGRRVVLAKPMTFMNNSGQPVRKLVNFYKVRKDCQSESGSLLRGSYVRDLEAANSGSGVAGLSAAFGPVRVAELC